MRIFSRFTPAFCLVLVAALSLQAGSSSLRSGMDTAKLAEIPRRMQAFVESNQISGAVTLVMRRGEVIALEAVGFSDLATRRRMRTDDLFWIASMTKPITATAVLMLQDEGKLSVNDPVEKHLPEFKGQWLAVESTSSNLTLMRPPRPVLIRDLLTHTSGLGDVPAPRVDCSLAELVMAYSQAPLRFPPGTKWQYSNPGINTLGRIVEVVSGIGFAEFLQKRIFDPLDMDDTTFWPRAKDLKRLAKSYQPGTNGPALVETAIWFMQGQLTNRKRTAHPSGGLFSTAEDVAAFYRMMLNNGMAGSKRLLSTNAIAELTRTQTGEIKTGFVDGMSFGYGFAVVKEPKGVTRMLSPGTFGHGGAYGTQVWADPKRDLTTVLMIQRAKLPNADGSHLREALQEAAVAAVAE
jgi:CubicO group peptidase (beta-lactamase class C family)